jgi:phage tail tape-measure protein
METRTIPAIRKEIEQIKNRRKMMEKREIYIEKFTVQLKKWNSKIDKLTASAENASGSVGKESEKLIGLLRQKTENAKVVLQQLKDADINAWERIAEGTQKAWNDLNQAVHAAGDVLKWQVNAVHEFPAIIKIHQEV